MKRPAFQLYPADWRKDAALQSCSMAAQGLWINTICVAHECEPYGHLMVNGKPMNAAQIGRLVGVSTKECEILLLELGEAGVFSVTPEGAIYSRRMVRDERARDERAAIGRVNGAKGGEFGVLGAKFGKKGGRPRTASLPIQADEKPGVNPAQEPPENPLPSSSSSSSREEKRDMVPAGPSLALQADETQGSSSMRHGPGRRVESGCPTALIDRALAVISDRRALARFAEELGAQEREQLTRQFGPDTAALWRVSVHRRRALARSAVNS
jgi:hypothetical protein